MTTENLLPEPSENGSRSPFAFEERYVGAVDGGCLRLCSAAQHGEVRAELLVTHGLGEHAGRYAHFAENLVARGVRVHVYDLRGHGRSAGRRGDVESYEILLDDLQRIHERVAASGLPVFLYGHSMGGQIALRFLQRDAPPVAGIVAASPWLRLAFAPPRWKLALARLAMCVFPRFSQGTGMRLERLTRDREHVEAMADQALMFHRISARMFFAVHAQGERVIADAGLVRAPLLLLHGDADAVTCWRATVDLHGSVASADRTLRIFPAAVHELHNDVIRTEVMEVVGSWLVARI